MWEGFLYRLSDDATMPSDLTGSSGDDGLLDGNRSVVLGGALGLLLLLVVGVLLGPGRMMGGIFFVVSMLLYLVVVGLVLWLLYRIAIGVERIAAAQERMVRSTEIRAGGDGNSRPDRE